MYKHIYVGWFYTWGPAEVEKAQVLFKHTLTEYKKAELDPVKSP